VEDIDRSWFLGKDAKIVERVGITGATSTPRWLMEAVKEKVYGELRVES
jgi:4-hydroxy-3-methylbut-2-enyl diphosphate reductase IspH